MANPNVLAVAVASISLGLVAMCCVVPASGQSTKATPPPATIEAPAPEADADASGPKRLVLRVLTDNDFPPFNYLDDEGVLAGLNVDLARSVCLELNLTCDIQVKPWDELVPSLQRGTADLVIAGHRVSGGLLGKIDFSATYLEIPAFFSIRRDAAKIDMTPEALEEKKIAVQRGSAHEAYLRAFFRDSKIEAFDTVEQAREALQASKVDGLFEDGVSLMFWLNGTLSRQCCELAGGPFFDAKYFGDGMAIALPKGDQRLKAQINSALMKIRASGRFEELMLRYFPHRLL